MDIVDFREYCLGFPCVREKMPFGRAASEYDRGLLVFCVADRWFCFVNMDLFDFCNVKCEPERIEELRDLYDGVRPGYHMNKRHWVSLFFDSDVPENTIKELVRHSYELVAASLSEREKKLIL